jgi:hypothetical protein
MELVALVCIQAGVCMGWLGALEGDRLESWIDRGLV